jgi:hypothetical protein
VTTGLPDDPVHCSRPHRSVSVRAKLLVIPHRFLLFDELQVWWPNSYEEVFPVLARSPVVTVNQCSDEVASALEPHAFQRKPFHTLLIDLTLPEKELWSRLAKSGRALIRRVRDLGCSVSVNENAEEALGFINEFVRHRKFRRPITVREWRRHLEYGDVFTAKHEGRILAAHLVLVDRPHRARLLLGGRVGLEARVHQSLFGGVERYLHWRELTYYKAAGIPCLDLAGVTLDQHSPLYSITRFKLSFGGEIVGENTLRLARNRGLRFALKALARGKQLRGTLRGYPT